MIVAETIFTDSIWQQGLCKASLPLGKPFLVEQATKNVLEYNDIVSSVVINAKDCHTIKLFSPIKSNKDSIVHNPAMWTGNAPGMQLLVGFDPDFVSSHRAQNV